MVFKFHAMAVAVVMVEVVVVLTSSNLYLLL